MVTRNAMLLWIAFVLNACCPSLDDLTDKRFVVLGEAPPAPAARSVRYGILETYQVFHDPRRDRDIEVKFYAPETGAKNPVVIFSHGIGEDRDSYEYIGRAVAQRGYLTVHVTHSGTDKAVLRRGYWKLYNATKKKESWTNRPLDVSFVIDQLARRTDVDLERIAVVGHSAGAFTAFAVAGARLAGGESFRDERVKAIVGMSMPRMEGVVAPGGYGEVKIPALSITGNCDSSFIYRTKPKHRRVPFEEATGGGQYLVTIEGVNHNTFSNRADRHHEAIVDITAAFLDGYLRDDPAARGWLDHGAHSAKERIAMERK